MSFESKNNKTPYPLERCIHELFEEQVRQTPDAVAVVFENQQLTYHELNCRANQLGHYLQGLGVGPEVLVGICVERSLEMIVGLLGILKAGGAYLPLDPAYPPERLSFMLRDAGVGVLLTQQRLREKLSSQNARVIALDADWKKIANEDDRNPANECAGANLAYVIYTSGSTGKPKGVCVSHSSVVHLVTECQADFSFGVHDVWTVVHSYAFDFSVWEIFGALLTGGRLVVAPLWVTQSPPDLLRLLREQRITILNQTPSAARQLLDVARDSPKDELSLRLLICGGEALPSNLAAELLGWNVPLWNFYGPTESTVWATFTRVGAERLAQGSVSIGSAIRDLETYVLDRDLQPVAAGRAGELHLGGTQLARGYLNRPELTAERFVPNGLSNKAGARLYKTGDLARSLPDGNIEHLGRLDHQVKVRGFRIELEEIEAVVVRHPLVREAVVTVNEDETGAKQLIAYVVARGYDGESKTLLEDRRLLEWLDVWDETYGQASATDDPTFNIIGWNSSYTGLPYSAAEMKEWVDRTVARIRALRPQRVLEIGCGSGLLLFSLAPSCEYYLGTDPSPAVQALLQKQLGTRGRQLGHVALSQRTADDFEGFEPESFDTVIINSVAQYFPSVEYLRRVLEQAVRVTKSGGAVFVGDVRNLALLNLFHTSVQLSQAPNHLSAIDLLERVRKHILHDEQLAIDASFFAALQSYVSRIGDVEIQLKQGRAENETTKFRYDVCLRVDTESVFAGEPERVDWQTRQLTLPQARELLLESESADFLVMDVPNSRVVSEVRASELLGGDGIETVADLRARLRGFENTGIDPGEWWKLGSELKRAVKVTWAASGKIDCYDVRISCGSKVANASVPSATPQSAELAANWRRFGNNPLQGAFSRRLVPQLRTLLRESLPEYMVPSTFVLLEALPLTPNAKIDRSALPAPDSVRPELERAFLPPRNELEAKLAEVWASVLKIDRVGVSDNFIELGGHSVLATQIISRVRDLFLVEMTLRAVFEHPTVAALAQQIENVRSAQTQDATSLRRATRDASSPLSFAQQRLWFLDQLVPHTPVYNMLTGVRLPCALDVAALEKSLNEIVRRHETLRTTIAVVGGQPHQIIAPELKLTLPLVDLRELSKTEREGEALRQAKQEAESLFDLARGPLVCARLLRLGQEDYVLLVTMHHIISDNWSTIVFFEELSALYEAFSKDEPSPLAELSIQYVDYALWQRDEAQIRAREEQLGYWKRQVAGAPTVLELPADYSRPAIASFRSERHSVTLSKSLVHVLRTFARREGATTFMTLLAVLNVLLHRYTGQEDILIGSPIANRVRIETEGLIGLFLNNLVLRTKLAGEASFRELLEQVRETALGAYAHQDVPFEKLVEELQPKRDLSRAPLFQVFFNLFDSADNEIEFAGVTAEVFSPVEGWSQFDLTLYAADQGETIELTLAYNTDLFAPARMAEMLAQFASLLEQILAQPDKQLAEYSLVTASAEALLPDPTVVLPEPDQEPITATFLSRAAEFSDQSAIRKGNESWSYQDLADRSLEIAGALLRDELQKGEVVAVTGPPSLGLIAGMIGVLRSGGVLLTLDRGLPVERRQLMLREAKAGRLLHVGEWKAEDDTIAEALVVTQIGESDGRLIGSEKRESAHAKLPELKPDDPAYLFFTSGTTGVPKGILGSHKGLSHFLAWQREQFSITPADRAAQLTGLSFDVVLRDIFLPLTSGASLHLPDDASDVTSGRILSWLERERITLLHTVPTLAQTWLRDSAPGAALGSLRWAFFAGEPLTDSLVRNWRKVFPSAAVVNLYGPTETTLAKCFYVVPDNPSFGVQAVGRPLRETQALVLNQSNVLCGIGEPGEIVIRTPFRTLGYVNAPEENRVRFIANPFRDDPNDLIYRTGDRGRYRPDGELEILGRLDDQIKIRGVRIEPNEVNAALARHPSVRASFIKPIKDQQGENALAAYIVSATNPTTSELRSYLSRQLPAAMVPSYYIFLDALPLTPNGKVDRLALPAPDPAGSSSAQQFVEPRNAAEEMVAEIWTEVLGLERVGVCDNFFELGGHSLKATQVMARIYTLFQIDVPLQTIFEKATVAELASAIEDSLIRELEELPEDEPHLL